MNRLLISAAMLGLISASPAFAQGAPDSTTADAHATIVSSISITKTQDMSFGNLTSPSSDTQVQMDASGNLTTGGLEVPGGTLGQPAIFDVAGDTNFTYSVDITDPDDTISLTDQGTANGAPMTLVLAIDGTPATGRTISGANNDVIITGTLTVNALQAPSVYKGTMTVQVVYD